MSNFFKHYFELFLRFTQIMPQIAPTIELKRRSVKRVLSNTKLPFNAEKEIKARIVNMKPIHIPPKSPLLFSLLKPKNVPKKTLIPLMTSFIGSINLSEMLVNLKIKANKSIPISETQSAIKDPFKIESKKLLLFSS